MTDFTSRRVVMVDTQVRPSDVTKFPIIDAMLTLPREAFVPDDLREAAYVGEHLEISDDRTMLDPRTFAKMLEVLDIAPRHVVLDVACGLGYSTAVLAKLAEFVVGLEDDEKRADEAQSNLSEAGIDNAAIMAGELAEGAAKSGPYDVILVEGGVEVIPDALTDQLREGGRICAIFHDGSLGTVRVGHKIDGAVNWRFAFNASAPLLDGFKKAREFAL